jgi:RND family efflux transporter MFP subunit
VAAVVAPLILTLAVRPLAGQGPGGGAAAVVVAPVVQREVAESGVFVGTLMPLRRSTVGSAVDGRVVALPITEGDWVAQGEPLCRLLTQTIEIELAAAEAELKLRQQEYEELKNGSRPEEIAQARARLEETRATMVFAKDKLTRTQRLFESRISASREELDQALSQAQAAEQMFLAAQASYELAVKGPRQERVLQAQARMEQAQQQRNLLMDRLEKFTIRAPFDGYVVARHTEQGAWIRSGDAVAEVVAIDPMEVTVHVPESQIGGLQHVLVAADAAGQPVRADVRIAALGPEVFSGEVARIVPQADLKARTFPVKLHVANPREGRWHRLKAGMLAQVTLPVGPPVQATLVPKDALVLGGPFPQVLVLAPSGAGQAVRAVPVEVGLAQGTWIAVRGQVTAGDRVVVRGNERLRDGQRVEVLSVLDAPPAEPQAPPADAASAP